MSDRCGGQDLAWLDHSLQDFSFCLHCTISLKTDLVSVIDPLCVWLKCNNACCVVAVYKCSEWLVCFSSPPLLFFLPLVFCYKRDLLCSSLFQILFPGSFDDPGWMISTSFPVLCALLRSLMSGALGLIFFCREQEKAGCTGHRILWELWTLGEESRG